MPSAPRLASLLIVLVLGCTARDGGDPPTAQLAGQWRAQATTLEDLEDELALGEDGLGDAKIHRMTSALFAQSYVVSAEPDDDDPRRFLVAFECPDDVDEILCEMWTFTSVCDLESDDTLNCTAPSWYHEDTLAFTRAD